MKQAVFRFCWWLSNVTSFVAKENCTKLWQYSSNYYLIDFRLPYFLLLWNVWTFKKLTNFVINHHLSRYLLAQRQQWKYQNNVWNLFKVQDKENWQIFLTIFVLIFTSFSMSHLPRISGAIIVAWIIVKFKCF